MQIKKITIIGLGLLGSSIARAVKAYASECHITAYDTQTESVTYAVQEKFVDVGCSHLKDAVQNADMVILASPLSSFAPLTQEMMPFLKAGAILTDTGSVKGSIIAQMSPFIREDIYFMPAHPIAGTEQSGVEAGFANLFIGKRLIYTPFMGVSEGVLTAFYAFWQSIGMHPEQMDASHHDHVFAVVSHIPHLIAYNIVGTASDLEQVSQQEVIRYAASGFRDFTRLAASNPIIWRDVFLHNKQPVLEMLGRFTEDLMRLQRLIRDEDGDELKTFFAKAQKIRQELILAGTETASVNFGRETQKSVLERETSNKS